MATNKSTYPNCTSKLFTIYSIKSRDNKRSTFAWDMPLFVLDHFCRPATLYGVHCNLCTFLGILLSSFFYSIHRTKRSTLLYLSPTYKLFTSWLPWYHPYVALQSLTRTSTFLGHIGTCFFAAAFAKRLAST